MNTLDALELHLRQLANNTRDLEEINVLSLGSILSIVWSLRYLRNQHSKLQQIWIITNIGMYGYTHRHG